MRGRRLRGWLELRLRLHADLFDQFMNLHIGLFAQGVEHLVNFLEV